jgi:hypothetical protein
MISCNSLTEAEADGGLLICFLFKVLQLCLNPLSRIRRLSLRDFELGSWTISHFGIKKHYRRLQYFAFEPPSRKFDLSFLMSYVTINWRR